MTLKIYGTPASRTFRTLWMANELGIKYENIPTDFRKGQTRAPDYMAKVNPNGHIPAIDDDGCIMWESLAINLYLAKKHGGPIAPKTPQEDGLATQWSIWALTEAEPPIVTMLMNRLMLPEAQRDAGAANKASDSLKAPMAVLNKALDGKQWLIGDRFTVADLNVSGVTSTARRVQFDLKPYANVDAWITRCLSRPAAQEADKLRQDAMKQAA
jgi:glutathione S-transferase